MQRHLTRISVGSIQAVRATPVEAALAFGAAAVTSLRIAEHLSGPTTLRIVLGCVLAFAAVFAASASHALGVIGRRARWLLTAVAVGATALATLFIFEPSRQTEMWRWAILLIAGVAAVLLVPAAAPASELSASERYWRFAVRLGARAAAALAYGSLLFGGIAVALWALERLFGISVHAQVYGHAAAWVFFAVTPLVALGGLAEAKRVNDPLPAGTIELLGTAGTFLFVPLLLLYLLLLCSYVAKVAVTQVVPSNVLSPLTLGAGALGYFGQFALHPHLLQQERRALRWVLQLFPIAFLVLVPVGLWSVLTRVGQYGWTEFRYVRAASLACLGLISLLHALATLRRRAPSLAAGPALALAIALLAAVGPLSASRVSAASQLRRAGAVALEGGLLGSDGRLLPREQLERRVLELPASTRRDLESTIAYLIDAHGDRALAPLSAIPLSDHATTHAKLQALGLRSKGVPAQVQLFRQNDRPFALDRGGRFQSFYVGAHAMARSVLFVELRLDGTFLVVRSSEREYRASLAPVSDDQAAACGADYRSRPLSEEEVVRPLRDAHGALVGQVVIDHVGFEADAGGWRATNAAGLLVLY